MKPQTVLNNLILQHGASVVRWLNFPAICTEHGIDADTITSAMVDKAKATATKKLTQALKSIPTSLEWTGPFTMESEISRTKFWLSSDNRYRVLRRFLKFGDNAVEYLVEYRRMVRTNPGEPIWDFLLRSKEQGYYPRIFKSADAAFMAAAEHAQCVHHFTPNIDQSKPAPAPVKAPGRPVEAVSTPEPSPEPLDLFGADPDSGEGQINAALSDEWATMQEIAARAGLAGKMFFSHLNGLAKGGKIEKKVTKGNTTFRRFPVKKSRKKS